MEPQFRQAPYHQNHLVLVRTIYTEFTQALNTVITPKVGDISAFMNLLQSKLEEKQPISPEVPKTILDR